MFRRTQPREESEFIVVPLRLAPIPMDGRDERLGILNAEAVDDGSVSLSDPGTLQTDCGVMSLGIVSMSKFEARRSTLIALL